jgi:hypothetical protein
MGISRTHRRKVLWIGPLLVALLVAGCAGIEPYEPRNNREEGPQKGLFSGSEGEFVIFRKANDPETDRETSKRLDETSDGKQQKTGSEKREKKTKTESGEQ